MRIGLLSTSYPHARDPVAGAFVRGMARALARRGHAVKVLCAPRAGDVAQGDTGVEVVAVRLAPRVAYGATFYGGGAPDKLARGGAGAWAGAVAFTTALAAHAARALRDCDALVSHFALPCGAVGSLVRGARPHLAVVHGTDGQWLARLPGAAQRAVLAGATAVRFSHAGLRDALAPGALAPGTRVEVAPVGFDPAPPLAPDARAARRRALLGDDTADTAVLALAVARLVPVKALDTLIDAAAQARSGAPSLSVVIAGDGPERAALAARIAATRAPVRLLGAVDAATRDALLAAADVFVAPARALRDGRTEGAPAAVVEAMGAGLPVVAARAGGLGELVGDAGELVAADDARALADALARLARDPARRAQLGERGRARTAALTWDADAQRVERVLRG